MMHSHFLKYMLGTAIGFLCDSDDTIKLKFLEPIAKGSFANNFHKMRIYDRIKE
jgi:hypothetical protein